LQSRGVLQEQIFWKNTTQRRGDCDMKNLFRSAKLDFTFAHATSSPAASTYSTFSHEGSDGYWKQDKEIGRAVISF